MHTPRTNNTNLIAAENAFYHWFWSDPSRLSYMGKLGSRKDPVDHKGNRSWKVQQIDRSRAEGKPTKSFGNCASNTRIPVKSRFSEKRGRKKQELTASEESIILKAHEEYKVNALTPEKVMEEARWRTQRTVPTQFIDSGTHIMHTYDQTIF